MMKHASRSLMVLLVMTSLNACQLNTVMPSAIFALATEGASLTVHLGPIGGYRPLFLRVTDWDVAEGELRGAEPGAAHRATALATTDQSTHDRVATLAFTNVPPGVGYKLVVTLKKRDAVGQLHPVGLLSRDGLSLSAGTNTVSLAETGGLAITVPPTRVLGAYVTSVPLHGPTSRLAGASDVAVDSSGTVYVASGTYVRRIMPDNLGRPSMTTVAGGPGYIDGPGMHARFSGIIAIALVSDHMLYVLESHGAIRKIIIDAQGDATVSTLIPNERPGYLDGDGAIARFNLPTGIAVGPDGSLYVADNGNKRIRKVALDAEGRATVSTLAGSGSLGYVDGPGATARFSSISRMVVDQSGAVYLTDRHGIRKVTADAQGVVTVSTVAGGVIPGHDDGPVPEATFELPAGLALDHVGNLIVADSSNRRIRKLTFLPGGGAIVSTLAGSGAQGGTDGPSLAATFNQPVGVAIYRDMIFVADQSGMRIRKIAADESGRSIVSTLAGDGTSGHLDGIGEVGTFGEPHEIISDQHDNLYVTDWANHRIWRVRPDGTIEPVAGDGTPGYQDGPGQLAKFNAPHGIALDADGNIYISEGGNRRIRKLTFDAYGLVTVSTFAGNGVNASVDGPAASASFMNPAWMTFDRNGHLIVSDSAANRIKRISTDAEGPAIVSTLAGGISGSYADGPGTKALFNWPAGLAAAQDGSIYVADQLNNRIRKLTFDSQGTAIVSTVAGGTTGSMDGPGPLAAFDQPLGLTIDRLGTLYVGEYNGTRVRRIAFDSHGNAEVATIAGGGRGYADGPASNAQFDGVSALCMGSSDAIFVADRKNLAIRKITLDQ